MYKNGMAITDLASLSREIELTEDEKEWREDKDGTLPLLISDHIVAKLGIPAIRRQFVPSSAENIDRIGTMDPLEEVANSQSDRLIHRYGNRVAFLVTDRCFAYCRHCFRRRFTGTMTGPCSISDIERAARYIRENGILEVLLTGGDMFTLSDSMIDRMLSIFKSECPDAILRLCTRAVATNPGRFTDSLMEIIKKHQHGAPFYLMTQFNHPEELDDEATEAVRRFIDAGIPAMNQCVLLRGVNDSADVQIELCNRLLRSRIKPYYLFQGDLVRGTAHLRVDIEKGLEIEMDMRKKLSGLAMPQYTIDLPEGGGKVILTHQYLEGKDDGCWVFSTPSGEKRRYPVSK